MKWKTQIDAILKQKAAIEAGEIPPTFIERTIDSRIESDCRLAEMKNREFDGGVVDTDYIEMTDDRNKWLKSRRSRE